MSAGEGSLASVNPTMDDNSDPGGPGPSEPQEGLPGFKSVDDFIKAGYLAVLQMTKSSNTLPNEDNFPYYASYPAFEDAMAKQGNQALRSIATVLHSSGLKGNILRRDMEEKFELLLDANDTLLERAANNLDEVAGIRKNPEIETPEVRKISRPLSGSWNQTPPSINRNEQMTKSPLVSSPSVHKYHPKVKGKPQFSFPDKIDNSPKPFEPIIKEKPNALKPLSSLLILTEFGECFSHPYEYELDMFNPPEHQLVKVEPKKPRTEHIPLKLVETVDQLNHMISHLRDFHEIAVDLEHHNYRSFQGFTCLMQISTRQTDFIVDTLKLRGKLQGLNEIFTDPKRVKVLHGADSDVEWLQRDLGVYLVNMFDTHQAGKLLNLPRLSLAFLIKYYCDIDLDKSYQLADWRIRPIPQDMIEYARKDTHYLLYVYDRIKCDLWEAGQSTDRLVRAALVQSTILCKKIYVKPRLESDGHLKLYRKSRKMFNNRQLWAMREIYAWRFNTAMNEDESVGYVLPNHMLLQISETLPREMQGILACCNPIPALVRQNLTIIHRIVLQAREQPLIQTEATEDSSAARTTQTEWTKINIESTLHCPHQLPQKEEQTDLPSLLGEKKPDSLKANGILKSAATIAIFSAFGPKVEGHEMTEKVLSPYQRYLMVKPYMQYLANIEAMKEAEANKRKPDKSTISQPTLQRMEQIHMHFDQLDSRTAAQAAPPPRLKEESDDEPEEPPNKKIKTDEGVKEEDVLEFSDVTPEEAAQYHEEKVQPFRPGKKNLSVDQARSNFERNWNKNKQKKRLNTNNYQPEPGHGQNRSNRGRQQHGQNSHRGGRGGKKTHNRFEGIDRTYQQVPPPQAEEAQAGPSHPFNYNQVDFNRFQGGSKQQGKKQNFHKNRGGKNQKKRFNFPQRQNQKSFTYKS